MRPPRARRPRTAGAAIKNRAVYPGVWDFAGGHVEPGESFTAALVHELAEELGVTVTEPTTEPALVLRDEAHALRIWVITDWTGLPSNMQPDARDEVR